MAIDGSTPIGYDIPQTASTLNTASSLSANVGNYTFTALAELAVSTTGTVTNMYLINKTVPMQLMNEVINFQMANKDTRFENMVFAITSGYAASGRVFPTDQEFAKSACDLARAIAFQMDMYQ